jgi:hypothetical protein
LPQVDPLPGISGRLWDITRPLFQICLMVCPERYDDLVGAVLDIAGQRTTEKRDSFDGLIIQALSDCITSDAAHYEIATADVTVKFNELWKGEKPKNEKWMGWKIKPLMGKKADTSSGRSIIKINRTELETLFSQFGITNSLTVGNNSENSEKSDNATNSKPYQSELLSEAKTETQKTQKPKRETQNNSKGDSQAISAGFELSELSGFFPVVAGNKIIEAVEVWS